MSGSASVTITGSLTFCKKCNYCEHRTSPNITGLSFSPETLLNLANNPLPSNPNAIDISYSFTAIPESPSTTKRRAAIQKALGDSGNSKALSDPYTLKKIEIISCKAFACTR